MHCGDERGDRRDLARRAERREDPDHPLANPRGGEPGDEGSDLAALPSDLRDQSLSRTQIILPFAGATRALAELTGAGFRLERWEGWVKMRDGGRARSLAHGGSFALPRDPGRAMEVATHAMTRARERWQRDPEYPGAELYFALAFRVAERAT